MQAIYGQYLIAQRGSTRAKRPLRRSASRVRGRGGLSAARWKGQSGPWHGQDIRAGHRSGSEKRRSCGRRTCFAMSLGWLGCGRRQGGARELLRSGWRRAGRAARPRAGAHFISCAAGAWVAAAEAVAAVTSGANAFQLNSVGARGAPATTPRAASSRVSWQLVQIPTHGIDVTMQSSWVARHSGVCVAMGWGEVEGQCWPSAREGRGLHATPAAASPHAAAL